MHWPSILTTLAIAYAVLDYTPFEVAKPLPEDLVRSASQGLHPGEHEYRSRRKPKSKKALVNFLKSTNISFDPEAYDSIIGIAFSGGGHRAMLLGAGQLMALDSRSSSGGLAGVLQASAYVTGLSGGSWMLGSLIFNGFPTIEKLVLNPNIWNLDRPLFSPKKGGFLNGIEFYGSVFKETAQKRAAGYPVTITDVWGRMLMRQLIDQTKNTPWLWSHLKYERWYQDADAPYPIVTVNSRTPASSRANISSPIFEFTPYELGSFDTDPYAFANLEYLGTPAYMDKPYLETGVKGLDNAGFILGISSSLFDEIISGIIERITNSPMLADFARQLLHNVGMGELKDVALISPNPFYEHKLQGPNPDSVHDKWQLGLADAGSSKQNIPIQPLLQPERQVDVIFAFDNGGAAMDCAWPDGFSLSQSYLRQFVVNDSPPCVRVPDKDTMVNLGLVERPTFFGCYADEMDEVAPLIVYIPNEPYNCYSNTSTFQLIYDDDDVNSMINNGFNTASMGNMTRDPNWATCVACAVTQRSRERAGDEIPPECVACFNQYGWNGSLDTDPIKARSILRREKALKFPPG